MELKEKFFLKETISCNNHVQPEFFNTGGVKGRTEFEYICSICGADPECSPLVADAVLGTKEGKKFLPICEDCHSRGMKSNLYGKKDQQKAAAESTGSKRKAKAAATGLVCGRSRGRGRGIVGAGERRQSLRLPLLLAARRGLMKARLKMKARAVIPPKTTTRAATPPKTTRVAMLPKTAMMIRKASCIHPSSARDPHWS